MTHAVLAALAALLPIPQEPADADAAVLRARLASPAVALTPDAAASVLWTMNGGDNAACVRGGGDFTGDGVPDVVVGLDISGTNDNLFAVSGASVGTGSVAWSIETQGGASGGSFWGDECLTVASDFTGDGIPEILGGVAWGGRSANCFNGADGSIVWQFDTYNAFESGWVYSVSEIPDVTGDGVNEVVFCCGSNNDSVYCVDGTSTGTTPTILWSYQALDAVFDATWVPDVSGDGRVDVVAVTGDNDDRMYCLDGVTGAQIWVHDPQGTMQSVITIPDVDGDGKRDVVAATWNTARTATCVSSASGHLLWAAPIAGGFGMKVAALRDTNGDGVDEVLVGSWANATYCLDGRTGAELWNTPTQPTNGGDVWTVSSIPDVNGDGVDDAIAGSFDTNVYGLDGTDGSILWMQSTGNRLYSVSWIGDLNGDGKPEAIAGTQDTTSQTVVYAIEGDSGLLPPYLRRTGAAEIGGAVTLHTTGLPGEAFVLFLSLGTGNTPIATFGPLLLDPASLFVLWSGAVPSGGTDATVLPLANNPVLIGLDVHFQSLVGPDLFAGQGSFTNRESISIQ